MSIVDDFPFRVDSHDCATNHRESEPRSNRPIESAYSFFRIDQQREWKSEFLRKRTMALWGSMINSEDKASGFGKFRPVVPDGTELHRASRGKISRIEDEHDVMFWL